MIRDLLITQIEKEFAGWEMTITPNENSIVRFPSVQKEVGGVVIYDDGEEATVCIEGISHGHFTSSDVSRAETGRDLEITEDVIDFLKALFSDRVLLFTTTDHKSGGWMRLDLQEGPAQLSSRYQYFLWSKPYQL
jgi:hypothetical protein